MGPTFLKKDQPESFCRKICRHRSITDHFSTPSLECPIHVVCFCAVAFFFFQPEFKTLKDRIQRGNLDRLKDLLEILSLSRSIVFLFIANPGSLPSKRKLQTKTLLSSSRRLTKPSQILAPASNRSSRATQRTHLMLNREKIYFGIY